MKALVIGGNGYVGRHFVQSSTAFTGFVVADIERTSPDVVHCDVRQPLDPSIVSGEAPDWIVLAAAVHREPGHAPEEYFETNLVGAQNATAFASEIGCRNVFFLSSTSTYGSTPAAADEETPPCPTSPYGASKLTSELILRDWLHQDDGRRLIICRPGVVYGPGDPGNILRMIRAIKKGYFFFPGNRTVRKSYGYVYGLIASMDFTVRRDERFILYNYVERETEALEDLVRIVREEFGYRKPVVSLPRPMLAGVAGALQLLSRGRSPLHPTRVRKAALPSHIVPKWLVDHGFTFEYDFRTSLHDWRARSPEDFE